MIKPSKFGWQSSGVFQLKRGHEYFFSYTYRIREALEKLNDLVDESDPDTDLPNIVHAFQSKSSKIKFK